MVLERMNFYGNILEMENSAGYQGVDTESTVFISTIPQIEQVLLTEFDPGAAGELPVAAFDPGASGEFPGMGSQSLQE